MLDSQKHGQRAADWVGVLFNIHDDLSAASLPACVDRGRRLKSALDDLGLEKIAAAAVAFDVSEKTLTRWLGGAAIDIKTLIKAANAFNNDRALKSVFIIQIPERNHNPAATDPPPPLQGVGMSSAGLALLAAYRGIGSPALRVAVANRVFSAPCLQPKKTSFLSEIIGAQPITKEENALLTRLESLSIPAASKLVGDLLAELNDI